MNTCSNCSEPIDKQRVHLGYTECLKCSNVEAYSAHTVYPHKTGGYVQPVSKTTSNNLKRIDRRSVGNTRAAKGIYADKSWDRWLKRYYENKDKPKKKPIIVEKRIEVNHLDYNTLFNKVILHYKEHGYTRTLEYLSDLYRENKISMVDKSKITNELNGYEVIPKRLRKWKLPVL